MSISFTTLNTTDSGAVSRVTLNANFALIAASYPTGMLVGISDTQILSNKSLVDATTSFVDSVDNTKILKIDVTGTTGVTGILQSTFTTAKTLIFPDISDTLVTKTTTDTLQNKTLTKPIINASTTTASTYTPGAAGTATLDLSLNNQHYITMPAGNITIALSNDTQNQIFYVTITQDGVGSRTVTWFNTIKWAGGSAPTLTTTASKRDAFIFVRTGSGTYDGFIVGLNV